MMHRNTRLLESRFVLLWTRLRHPSENTRLLLLAVAVGLATGMGVWLFRLGIELFHKLFFETLHESVLMPIIGSLGLVVMVALAGLIVGWIVQHYVGEERHHGVAAIIESVALSGGKLRYATMPFKALASAISLGGGAAVGPEAPSVMIGANIGSFAAQKLRLSEDRMRLLVAAGAAAAISAAFRAPIAGVFFALEVILNGEFTTGSFAAVVIAAVTSSAFMGLVEEGGAEFGHLNYTLGSPAELIFYALLGLLLAPVAVFFIRYVHYQHHLWHRFQISKPLKTALAGVIVGAVGIFFPQILGAGREVITNVLSGQEATFTVGMLVLLAFAKIITNGISVAGGFVGGVFAPTLFVGSLLGSAFGKLITSFLPLSLTGTPPAYGIAGMAAVMAGVVRAPITAVLLAFELTNDYRLILPIMFTTVICVYLTERFVPAGIDTLSLLQSGIRLQQGRDVDVMQGIAVREVMQAPAPTITERATLTELRDALRKQHTRALCVVDDAGKLSGIVTLTDLQRAYDLESHDEIGVRDICTRDLVSISADDVVWVAIQQMGGRDLGQLPVINPRTGQLMGLVTRSEIMQAYQVAIARKREHQHKMEQVRLSNLTGAHVLELHITDFSSVAGRRICDVEWPAESLVASIQRDNRLIVPHGSTQFQRGDTVTIVAAPDTEDQLARLFGYETADVE
ncbi:MAG: chloride channel protein [Anaerolineae bacterium]|nr:chloride channel protein [Anaerolineae bacterium]